MLWISWQAERLYAYHKELRSMQLVSRAEHLELSDQSSKHARADINVRPPQFSPTISYSLFYQVFDQ
jgi:hypothetical protein